jgi:GWxTD domain-containing protein
MVIKSACKFLILILALNVLLAAERDPFKKWLEEDVVYIITAEEKNVFEKLTTSEEKEKFIEQFWLRRDPTPGTIENEFKEEHYRRIAYANEKFTAGIPGWMTDRGRIYIRYGKPDQVESYPAGGPYVRQPHEGGGETSVFPFERWWYRRLPGVGDGVEIEFVDDRGGGLYQIALDPEKKDELLYMPGGGLNAAELAGLPKKERVMGHRQAGDATWNPYERIQDKPLERALTLARLNRPPEIKHHDLRGAVVSTKISYQQLPFALRADAFKITERDVLVPVTIEIENKNLTYKSERGIKRGTVNLYGRVSNVAGWVASEFEDTITVESTEDRFKYDLNKKAVYQKKLVLAPGLYKLAIAAKDVESGHMGTEEQRLWVPAFAGDKLALSSVVLSARIEELAQARNPIDQFVFNHLKVIPNLGGVFGKDQEMGIYFQVYNYALDQASGRPALKIEYTLTPQATLPEKRMRRDISATAIFTSRHGYIARLVQLRSYPPGDYQIDVHITDTITRQTAAAHAEFKIE